MSEALRGFVLLLSVVLWLPVLRPFLDGQMRVDEAALRYAGALLLSWGGVSVLASLVRAYTPKPDDRPAPERAAGSAHPGGASRTQPAAAAGDPDGVDDGVSEFLPDGSPRRRAEDLSR